MDVGSYVASATFSLPVSEPGALHGTAMAPLLGGCLPLQPPGSVGHGDGVMAAPWRPPRLADLCQRKRVKQRKSVWTAPDYCFLYFQQTRSSNPAQPW